MPRTLPAILGPFYRGPANGYAYPRGLTFIAPSHRFNVILHIRIIDAKTQDRIDFASVEAWQADPKGVYDLSNPRPSDSAEELWPNTGTYRVRFTPYGRHQCDIFTVFPGPYSTSDFTREPHIHFRITKPGYETLVTQVFFPRDAELPPPDDPYYVPENTVEIRTVIQGVSFAFFTFEL